MCRPSRWLFRLRIRRHENHIQASNRPAIRPAIRCWWARIGPGHLFELDPLLVTLIRKALRYDHVALALVVWRQAAEVSEPHPKCGMKW